MCNLFIDIFFSIRMTDNGSEKTIFFFMIYRKNINPQTWFNPFTSFIYIYNSLFLLYIIIYLFVMLEKKILFNK